MKRLLVALCAALFATPAQAYTLVTSVSESCHERLTFEAISLVLAEFEFDPSGTGLVVPTDRVTRRFMDNVRRTLPEDTADELVFIAMSMITGVRAPDTEGHSTLNLTALRRLHADPSPIGQYAHALRGPADDGLQGDLTAIEGTKQVIREEIALALAAARVVDGKIVDVIEPRPLFVDHYGTVDLKVSLVGYHLGRALHAMQDAHAHMVRSGENYEHIVHVTNYVDAVNGHLKESRDGLAHSDALDDCSREDVAPIAEAARARSVALANAFGSIRADGGEALERGLSACPDNATDPFQCGWLEYEPVCQAAIEAGDTEKQAEVCCTAANDFCEDTVPAAKIAHEDPAGPYLGCQTTPGAPSGANGWWVALIGLLGLLGRRRLGAAVPFVLLLVPGLANAQATTIETVEVKHPWSIALEGHGAAINDTPNASFLDVEFGYTLRAGYQIDRWRITAVVDRSWWVPMEFGVRVDRGTLNLGIGGEVHFFDGFIRSGITLGTASLLFDTAFDESGEFGYYSEMRPAGFRWLPIENLAIVFDPATITFSYPVVRNPPLRKLHRRASVGVEYLF